MHSTNEMDKLLIRNAYNVENQFVSSDIVTHYCANVQNCVGCRRRENHKGNTLSVGTCGNIF
jgi:hypothetical protein